MTAGDTVVVDDPCYFNFRALLRAHRVKIIGVPYTSSGPDVEAFAKILEEHKPRLYITNAAIHNPTGATLSHATAYQILQLAQAAGLYIIEDDIFADFEVKPAPRLAALDGLSRVFYIGSFSKTLSASLRCVYIAAPNEWIESLLDLKIATGFGGGQLAAAVVLSALTDSGYRKHMSTIHTRLASARNQTLPMTKLGIEPWLIPQAGMFLWCQLPDENSATTLATRCLSQGVVLAPGNAFSQSKNTENFMRFNVAQMSYRFLSRFVQVGKLIGNGIGLTAECIINRALLWHKAAYHSQILLGNGMFGKRFGQAACHSWTLGKQQRA